MRALAPSAIRTQVRVGFMEISPLLRSFSPSRSGLGAQRATDIEPNQDPAHPATAALIVGMERACGPSLTMNARKLTDLAALFARSAVYRHSSTADPPHAIFR